MKKTLVIALVLAALVAAPVFAGGQTEGAAQAGAPAGTITIAFIGNTTGDYAMYGVPVRNSVAMFFEQLNAAGGINTAMNPSELMLITDHIGLFCESPLRGPNLDEFGPRFPDQTRVYDQELSKKMIESAEELGIPLHKGVYAYTRGPQYETPAEIRALKVLGADAVGMSTVAEAIAASHSGMKVLAVSCITNFAAGISGQPLSHSEVMENANKSSENSIALMEKFFSKL